MWASEGHENLSIILGLKYASSSELQGKCNEEGSAFSNPDDPRSRLGYAEFRYITLQETEGTRELCKRMMDSKVCLKMAALHNYGFPQQQKVGRTPNFHFVDTALVPKTTLST